MDKWNTELHQQSLLTIDTVAAQIKVHDAHASDKMVFTDRSNS